MPNKDIVFKKYKEYKANIIKLNERQLELDEKIKDLEEELALEQSNAKRYNF